MNYHEALKVINPMAALKSLKIEGKEEGAYIYFPCPECNEEAIIRAYGEKKNIFGHDIINVEHRYILNKS